jgi:hypothetical protein
VVGQPLLDLIRRLNLDLLDWAFLATLSWRRVTGRSKAIGLCLIEVLDEALVVLLDYILGNTLHTKDLHLETLPVRKRILDEC